MSEKLRVLAFELCEESQIGLLLENYEVYLQRRGTQGDFSKLEYLLFRSGSFRPEFLVSSQKSELYDQRRFEISDLINIELQILSALDRRKTVCFLVSDTDDLLVQRLLRSNKVRYSTAWEGEFKTDITINRSEFTSFLKRYGATTVTFSGKVDDVICTVEESIVGFSKKVRDGLLIILPYNGIARPDRFYVTEMLRRLLDSLVSYTSKYATEPPSWVKAFLLPGEDKARRRLEECEKGAHESNDQLEEFSKMKSILWMRDIPFEYAVSDFFKRMGFRVRKDKQFEEDFWILKDGNEHVIVDARSSTKNLTRRDVGDIINHRVLRGKPDTFPALFVFNSFANANSLRKKDKAITSDVRKMAKQKNVLLLRTLDLLYLYVLMKEGKVSQKTLLGVFGTERGWLKVSADGYQILSK